MLGCRTYNNITRINIKNLIVDYTSVIQWLTRIHKDQAQELFSALWSIKVRMNLYCPDIHPVYGEIAYEGVELNTSFKPLKKRFDFALKLLTASLLLLCIAGISNLKFCQISQCPANCLQPKYWQISAIDHTLFFYVSHLSGVTTMWHIIDLNCFTRLCK